MTIGGWILMVGSLCFVWGVAGWCYWKILSGPDSSGQDSPSE